MSRAVHSFAPLTAALVMLGAAAPAMAQIPAAYDALGRGILHCYRPTARFDRAVPIREADVLPRGRFGRAAAPQDSRALIERYGEADIAWLRLYWRGVTGSGQVSDVAVLTRTIGGTRERRTELLADTGLVPVVPAVCRMARDWVRVE